MSVSLWVSMGVMKCKGDNNYGGGGEEKKRRKEKRPEHKWKGKKKKKKNRGCKRSDERIKARPFEVHTLSSVHTHTPHTGCALHTGTNHRNRAKWENLFFYEVIGQRFYTRTEQEHTTLHVV